MNDNYENELTGFLFSILYLIRDAEREGFKETHYSLLRALNSFIADSCSELGDKNKIRDFIKVINFCLASINLEADELDKLTEELEKIS